MHFLPVWMIHGSILVARRSKRAKSKTFRDLLDAGMKEITFLLYNADEPALAGA
jgi:hypothetical protein